MTDEFLQTMAQIRRRITPEMKKIGTDILKENMMGIFHRKITVEEVVETMLIAIEQKKAGIAK